MNLSIIEGALLCCRSISKEEHIKQCESRVVLSLFKDAADGAQFLNANALKLLLELHLFSEVEFLVKSIIEQRRRSLRNLSNIELSMLDSTQHKESLRLFLTRERDEMLSASKQVKSWVATMLQSSIATEIETKLFLLRLSADVSRYMFECTEIDVHRDEAKKLYENATRLSLMVKKPTDEDHLRLCAAYSALCPFFTDKEVKQNCEELLDEVLSYIDVFDRSSYQKVTAYAQIVQFNCERPPLQVKLACEKV